MSSDIAHILCPFCDNYNTRMSKFYSTICSKCHKVIPAPEELPIVKDNKEKREKLIRDYILPIIRDSIRRDRHAN